MKNIYKALAGFQQEVPAIHEGTKGYGYTYSDLKTIFKVINPILKKHKLGFTQLLEGTGIKTVIFHIESGESLESFVEIPQGVTLKGAEYFSNFGFGLHLLPKIFLIFSTWTSYGYRFRRERRRTT